MIKNGPKWIFAAGGFRMSKISDVVRKLPDRDDMFGIVRVRSVVGKTGDLEEYDGC